MTSAPVTGVPRPSVLVVTRIAFWLLGAGERMRLLALLWVLGRHVKLSVLFLGAVGPGDAERLRRLRVPCAFHALPARTDEAGEREAVRGLMSGRRFDACVIERIHLHFLLEVVPAGVRTILDTHDLEWDNALSRQQAGVSADTRWTAEMELEALSRYDRVLLIQDEDRAKLQPVLGERAMLAPHPVSFPRRPVRSGSKRLGFVASAWKANLHGLDWFADAVWPLIGDPAASLELFGWIGDGWRPGAHPEFVRHGFVADFDRIWGEIDVAVNPVRWGSGLKIKSVEAMGNGLPLVTTQEGARGISEAAGEAFVLADAPEAFAEACRQLLADPAYRGRIGEAAYAYAKRRFSPEACFGELVEWLSG